MTGIALDTSANGALGTPGGLSAQGLDRTALALEFDAFRARTLWRYQGAERRARRDRLGSLVQAGMDLRLTGLERAARAVESGGGAQASGSAGLERAAGVRTLLDAANDLESFLDDHADLLESGLAARAAGPLDARAAELAAVGIARDGADGAWTLDRPAFLAALARDPEGVDALLGGADDGLAPALAAEAGAIRAPGLDSRLVHPAALEDLGPSARVEVANLERSALLDVVEAAPVVLAPSEEGTPAASTRAQTRTETRAGAAPELGPGLLRGSA